MLSELNLSSSLLPWKTIDAQRLCLTFTVCAPYPVCQNEARKVSAALSASAPRRPGRIGVIWKASGPKLSVRPQIFDEIEQRDGHRRAQERLSDPWNDHRCVPTMLSNRVLLTTDAPRRCGHADEHAPEDRQNDRAEPRADLARLALHPRQQHPLLRPPRCPPPRHPSRRRRTETEEQEEGRRAGARARRPGR